MTGRSGHSAFQGQEEGSGPGICRPLVDSNIFQRTMVGLKPGTRSKTMSDQLNASLCLAGN